MENLLSRLSDTRGRLTKRYDHYSTSSLGSCIGIVDGKDCWWEATGQALRDFETLEQAICEQLGTYCPPVPGSDFITFKVYMIGKDAEKAVPTVMFFSKGQEHRRGAIQAMKKSGVLKKCPGFTAGSRSVSPDLQHLVLVGAKEERATDPGHPTTPREVFYDKSSPIRGYGMMVYVKCGQENRTIVQAATATVLKQNGKFLFQTVSHFLFEQSPGPRCTDEDDVSDYELMSETDEDEESEDDHGSQTSGSVLQESSSDFSDKDSHQSSSFPDVSSSNQEISTTMTSSQKETELNPTGRAPAFTPIPPKSKQIAGNEMISPLIPSFANLESLGFVTAFSVDKDWALVSVDDATVEMSLLSLEGNRPIMGPKQVAKCYRTAQVISYTRSSGYIIGTISESPLFTRLPDSTSFQEMYKVKLIGALAAGDSGSAVFDIQTGDYFGHIVAGCETTGIAYVMAAHHVFEEMESQMGAPLLLYVQPQDPMSSPPDKSGHASISSTNTNRESISHPKAQVVEDSVNNPSTAEEPVESPKRILEDTLTVDGISHTGSRPSKVPVAPPRPVVESTTILQMVAWGTRLSFGLYDFSAIVSTASGDIDHLAKEVNLLSLVLRQIGSNLKEDKRMTSGRAFDTVLECLEQCRVVFVQIEQLIPVRALQDAPGIDFLLVERLRTKLNWTPLRQSQSQYLLAYLESLKMTLSVMLQTLYTAKITLWSRSDWTPPPTEASKTNHIHQTQTSQLAADAVVTERLQLESLVIEQQLSILRANRHYGQLIQHLQSTLGYVPEYSPHPRGLVPYQEPSLAHNIPSSVQGEDLAMVRRISLPLIDILLDRWTKFSAMELRVREQLPFRSSFSNSKLPRSSVRTQRPPNNQPSISDSSASSGDEAEFGGRPKLKKSSSLPVFPIAEEGSGQLQPSTTGSDLPKITQHQHERHGILQSPPVASEYYCDDVNEGLIGSNTSNLGYGASINRKLFNQQQQQQQQQSQLLLSRRPIPWRICNGPTYWEFLDKTLTSSNSPILPQNARYNHTTTTEIMSEFVSRDALRERHHEYTRVKKDAGDKNRIKIETCYCIEGALTFNEIVRLVDLTTTIRYPPPRSRRSTNQRLPARDPSIRRSSSRDSAYHSQGSSVSGISRYLGESVDHGWEKPTQLTRGFL
jgi:hypothetical protein